MTEKLESRLEESKENLSNRENLFLSKISSLEKICKAKVRKLFMRFSPKIKTFVGRRGLTREGTERELEWGSGTETLIEGFQMKMEKMKVEVEDMQAKKADISNVRTQEVVQRISRLKRLMQKSKKLKEKQMDNLETMVMSNVKE